MSFATPSKVLDLPASPPSDRPASDRSRRADDAIVEPSRLLVHPASARVVLEVLQQPGDATQDLTRTIMADPALAAAVLRAANSAHLGYSRRVAGVRQATVMLGASLVNSLAASRVADLVFDLDAPDYPDWLWLHSLVTACSATVLARRCGESPDDAYTAGLLHEVGWLLGAGTGAANPDQDHAASGARLLSRWNLPERIAAAVNLHHARPAALAGPLERIVVAGHAFAASLGAGGPERPMTTTEALHLIGLGDARSAAIVAEIEQELSVVTADLTSDRGGGEPAGGSR
jgi:putative nucleotidyltransferase with HDIG domain